MPSSSLYKDLKAAGCELDSHESDLYVKATPEALAILAEWGGNHGRHSAEFFRHQVTGETWIDIPFAFDPWWDAKIKGRSNG
jgi:hypothetical protein